MDLRTTGRKNLQQKTNKKMLDEVDRPLVEHSLMTVFFFGTTRFNLGALVMMPEAMKK
jgi:hypothetical protein